MSVIHNDVCPVCKSKEFVPLINAKDHTVSHETFEICKCNNCGFRFTQDIPAQEAIGSYYQSEDYISHSDTKEGLVNRLYHYARSFMLDSKKQLLVQHSKNSDAEDKNLLDIGAGTGYFLNHMKSAGWSVEGIEVDPGARKFCKEKFDMDLHDNDYLFKIPEKSVSTISMWHVLEHVHALDDYMEQIYKILKPNGKFFIAVPNCESHDASKYGPEWAAWDVPRHLYHFTPNSMKILAERNGFKLIKKKLMPFDSFYVSMLSEKYQKGKSNLIGGVITGGISLIKAMGNVDKASSVIYILSKED